MTINEFVEEELKRLEQFKMFWIKGNIKDPEHYARDLKIWQWLDLYYSYCEQIPNRLVGTNKEIEEVGKLLKDRLRKLELAKCRILSKGAECDCNLCLVERLVALGKREV